MDIDKGRSKLMQNSHILVIDDDESLIKIIFKFMDNSGATLDWALNLAKAKEKIKDQVPDLILLDINLAEGENGLRLLKSIQSASKLKLIPTIIMTSDKQKGLDKKAISLGAKSFVQKPFKSWELVQNITSVLSKDEGIPQSVTLERPLKVKAILGGEIQGLSTSSMRLSCPAKFQGGLECAQVFNPEIGEAVLIPEGPFNQHLRNGVYSTLFSFFGIDETRDDALEDQLAKWRSKA